MADSITVTFDTTSLNVPATGSAISWPGPLPSAGDFIELQDRQGTRLALARVDVLIWTVRPGYPAAVTVRLAE